MDKIWPRRLLSFSIFFTNHFVILIVKKIYLFNRIILKSNHNFYNKLDLCYNRRTEEYLICFFNNLMRGF